MSEKKKNNKWLLFIGIPAILLIIVLRFVIYYFKSDGYSGLSIILPLLILCILIFTMLTSICFAAWVYQDCIIRKDDAALWAIIVFITTPFIGLLIYFLRRSELKQSCQACGHSISLKAKYCEECGTPIENKENMNNMKKQHTHHLSYIAAGVICMILMLSSLTGFIVSAGTAGNINTSLTSNKKIWNMGVIKMKFESQINGQWKLNFKSASDGYVAQNNMQIQNSDTNLLYADITCATVPENSSLTLWLVQGEISKSIDVTNLSEPLEYPLSDFENGEIQVRLEINGVKDTSSKIYIK